MKPSCSIIFKSKLAGLSIIFVCFSFQANAQRKSIQGVIFEKSSSIRVSKAKITNLTNDLVSQSDGLGVFMISSSIGDSLKISKEGYTDQNIIVSSYQDLIIKLSKPIQLSVVKVVGQSKKQELDEIKKQYRRKGSYYAGKPPLLSYIFTPLTALYELVGKTPGQAKRFNRYYTRELQQSEIDRRFNSYTVKPLTGYEGKDLQNFIETYRPSFEQIATWADYDLVNYIKKSAIAFETAGRPSAPSLPKLPKAPDLSEKIIIKY